MRRVGVLCVVLAACGGGGGGGFNGDPVTGDPFDPAALVDALARAQCDLRATCEPIFASFTPETPAQCVATVTAATLTGWNALKPLVDAHRVGFVRAEYDRCLAAVTAAKQDCALGTEPLACDGLFKGNRPAGIACGASQECAAGLYCAGTVGACGACAPLAQAGSSCKTTPCAPGTTCLAVDVNGTETCAPNTAAVGAPCGAIASGVCRGHLQCNGTGTALSCQRPAAPNAACTDAGDAPGCDIFAQQVCGAAATCVELTVVGPPLSCGANNRTNLCNADSRCDTGTNTCVALGAAGASCSETLSCAKDLHCERAGTASTGVCQARVAVGGTCTADAACVDNAFCIAGKCDALHYAICN